MNEEQLQQKQSKRMHRFLASVFTKFSYQIEHFLMQLMLSKDGREDWEKWQIFATTCNLMLGFFGWWSAHMTKIFFFLNLRKNNWFSFKRILYTENPAFANMILMKY